MELQSLRTFVAVARHLSFSKAAAHLDYSQAAVTVQIKRLEEDLGVRLFDRLGKTIRLTAQGEIFYDHAVEVLNALKEAKASVHRDEVLDGTLSIATVDSLCLSVFPDLLTRFHRAYPQIKISVTTSASPFVLEALQNNTVDLAAIADEDIKDPRFICRASAEEQMVFADVKGSQAALRSPCVIEDLLDLPFVLTEHASYRNVLDYTLRQRGLSVDPVFQCNNTELLAHMCRQGVGISFLPRYVLQADFDRGDLVRIDVKNLHIPISCQIIQHKDKWVTPEMQAFIDFVEASWS